LCATCVESSQGHVITLSLHGWHLSSGLRAFLARLIVPFSSSELGVPCSCHGSYPTKARGMGCALRRQQRTAEARPREHTRCGSTALERGDVHPLASSPQHPPRCICGCSGEACSREWERAVGVGVGLGGGGSRRRASASEPRHRQRQHKHKHKEGPRGLEEREGARKLIVL
jgi:hypothetical protein